MIITLSQVASSEFQKIVEKTNSPDNVCNEQGRFTPKIQVKGVRDIHTDGKGRQFYHDLELSIDPHVIGREEYSEFMEFLYKADGGKTE